MPVLDEAQDKLQRVSRVIWGEQTWIPACAGMTSRAENVRRETCHFHLLVGERRLMIHCVVGTGFTTEAAEYAEITVVIEKILQLGELCASAVNRAYVLLRLRRVQRSR